jgi:hypothetical protein
LTGVLAPLDLAFLGHMQFLLRETSTFLWILSLFRWCLFDLLRRQAHRFWLEVWNLPLVAQRAAL